MIEPKKFINIIIYTFISSLAIYWVYYGLFFTPLIKDEIDLIQNFSYISKAEKWDLSDYFSVIIINLFFDLCLIGIYIFIIIPLFNIFYTTVLNIEAKNQKFELLKVHFFHIVITLLFTYLVFKSENLFNT